MTGSRRRALQIPVVLLLALGSAGSLWYFSPAGVAWRLHRQDLPSLLAYTAQHPEDAAALRELAQRMESRNLLAEALQDYLQSTQAQPKNVAGWLGAARTALRLNDQTTAVNTAQQAVRLKPDSADAQFTLGQAYARGEKWDLAQTAFRQAVQREPDRADLWEALAEAAQERKDWQAAQEAALKATQLDGRPARYWVRLAGIRQQLGDLDGAKAAIEQARQRDPQDAPALTEQGILLAQSARSDAEREAARQVLEAAVARINGTAQAYQPLYELGQVLLALRRPAEAQRCFQSCLDLRPHDDAAAFALSRSLALQGKSAEARTLMARFAAEAAYQQEVAQLQMRISRQPQQRDLYVRLANLYAAHGDRESAQKVWALSRQAHAGSPEDRQNAPF